jgi:hypothetical protein
MPDAVPYAMPAPTLATIPPAAPAPAPSAAPLPLTLRSSFGSTKPADLSSAVPAAGRIDAEAYARICATQGGVLSCVVFDTVDQGVVAKAGNGTEAQRWVGAFGAMLDAARGLSLDAEGQEATVDQVCTIDRHVFFVRPLPGPDRLAMAVVLERTRANVPLLRTLAQRLDGQLVQ